MKYNLIRPFWFEIVVESNICALDTVFGIVFSSQMRSNRDEAVFWLMCKFNSGIGRCVVVGKNPSMFENLNMSEGVYSLRLFVMVFNSIASIKPMRVTAMAVNFKYAGIVIWGVFVGKILKDRKNPAKILPIIKRLIGLISRGLFSLTIDMEVNRGCPSSA